MKKLISLSLLSAAIVSFTYGDVLANWQLDSLEMSQSSAVVASADANITAGNLLGGGVAGWPDALVVLHHDGGVTNLATSIIMNDYFSFTLTPIAGTVSYDTIFARITVQANAFPATTEFSLLSSTTGFTNADVLATFSVTASTSGANHDSGTFDLSEVAALQNISGAVEFRIYYHDTGTNPMTRMGIGQAFATNGTPDLTVNGTTTVAVAKAGL